MTWLYEFPHRPAQRLPLIAYKAFEISVGVAPGLIFRALIFAKWTDAELRAIRARNGVGSSKRRQAAQRARRAA